MGALLSSELDNLKRHLANGNEEAVLNIIRKGSFQSQFDPNLPLKGEIDQNTALHLAAKHAMVPVLQIMLMELNGNPNIKNKLKETSLHLVCQSTQHDEDRKREECLQLLINWKAAEGKHPGSVQTNALDHNGNSPLHIAVRFGLHSCARLLLQQDSSFIFLKNENNNTSLDLVTKNENLIIETFLEMKMKLANEDKDSVEIESLTKMNKNCIGLRHQDLQEIKDKDLLEVSIMLDVRLFEAEALLRAHDWSKEFLAEAWINNKEACLKKSGLQPTNVDDALSAGPSQRTFNEEGPIFNSPFINLSFDGDTSCEICFKDISPENYSSTLPCRHIFCKECWEAYLTEKIKVGTVDNILCPAYECLHIVPVDLIDRVISPVLMGRYLNSDINAFVEGNPNVKWCQFPGCDRAVQIQNRLSPLILMADCGNGHFFCWECMGQAHDPCSCENWNIWLNKIEDLRDEDPSEISSKREEAANNLWLLTNSKPCPNCKAPIEKRNGCNVIWCGKCRLAFCWKCLQKWVNHTQEHFRCSGKHLEMILKIQTQIRISVQESNMQNLELFTNYSSLFQNENKILQHELELLKILQQKEEIVAITFPNEKYLKFLSFLKAAMMELLWARNILRSAYVYSYFKTQTKHHSTAQLDCILTKLKTTTSNLSEILDQPYTLIRPNQTIQAINTMRHVFQEFFEAVKNKIVSKRKRKTSIIFDTFETARKRFKNVYNFISNPNI